MRRTLLALAGLAAMTAAASAGPCDCTRKAGKCSATVRLEATDRSYVFDVITTTNTSHCAWVSYYINGGGGGEVVRDSIGYNSYTKTTALYPENEVSDVSCRICWDDRFDREPEKAAIVEPEGEYKYHGERHRVSDKCDGAYCELEEVPPGEEAGGFVPIDPDDEGGVSVNVKPEGRNADLKGLKNKIKGLVPTN